MISRQSEQVHSADLMQYVSPSRIAAWLRCPRAFALKYLEGVITPTTPNLFLGTVVHRALEYVYRYRQADVRLFPEFVAERIEKQIWRVAVEDELIKFGSTEEERAQMQQAVRLVLAYLTHEPSTDGAPIWVEKRLEAPLVDPFTGKDLGIPLVGIVDVVFEGARGPILVDFKTAGRASGALGTMHELQLSCYSYLLRHCTGQEEEAIEIRTLIKTKSPRVQIDRYAPRQDIHFERLFAVIRAYLEAIGRGNFHISPGLGCSFCDFRGAMCAGMELAA